MQVAHMYLQFGSTTNSTELMVQKYAHQHMRMRAHAPGKRNFYAPGEPIAMSYYKGYRYKRGKIYTIE
jgi:hypothetical protein